MALRWYCEVFGWLFALLPQLSFVAQCAGAAAVQRGVCALPDQEDRLRGSAARAVHPRWGLYLAASGSRRERGRSFRSRALRLPRQLLRQVGWSAQRAGGEPRRRLRYDCADGGEPGRVRHSVLPERPALHVQQRWRRGPGFSRSPALSGERRIRVHTLCLPVRKQLADVFHGADAQAVAAVLSKMGTFLLVPCQFTMDGPENFKSGSVRPRIIIWSGSGSRYLKYVFRLCAYSVSTLVSDEGLNEKLYWTIVRIHLTTKLIFTQNDSHASFSEVRLTWTWKAGLVPLLEGAGRRCGFGVGLVWPTVVKVTMNTRSGGPLPERVGGGQPGGAGERLRRPGGCLRPVALVPPVGRLPAGVPQLEDTAALRAGTSETRQSRVCLRRQRSNRTNAISDCLRCRHQYSPGFAYFRHVQLQDLATWPPDATDSP